MRARRETELPSSWRRGSELYAGSVSRGASYPRVRYPGELVCQLVVKDDYGPWTASTLRSSSEILLPADEAEAAG